MDEMLICGESAKCWKLQCKLFRISTNPVDEKTDVEKMNEFLGQNRIVELKSQYVTSKIDYWHIFVAYDDSSSKEPTSNNSFSKTSNASDTDIETNDARLVEKFKQWRQKEAVNRGWPLYRILTNSVIEQLSTSKPTAPEQLGLIKGVGSSTIENFGTDIINIITKHLEDCKK